jgi:hypothetical protein
MTMTRHPRLRAPTVTALGGGITALAVLVTVGWAAALCVAGVAVAATFGYYWLGGTDTDAGSMIGSRADERQSGVRLRFRVLAGTVTLTAALAGTVITSALNGLAWPFEVVVAVGVGSFLAGLVIYHAALGGRYSDLGSVVSARADERQVRIRLQATQLAGMTMFITAIIGAVTLTGNSSARPFQFLAAVYAVTLIAGMLSYWARGHRQQES